MNHVKSKFKYTKRAFSVNIITIKIWIWSGVCGTVRVDKFWWFSLFLFSEPQTPGSDKNYKIMIRCVRDRAWRRRGRWFALSSSGSGMRWLLFWCRCWCWCWCWWDEVFIVLMTIIILIKVMTTIMTTRWVALSLSGSGMRSFWWWWLWCWCWQWSWSWWSWLW